MFNIEGNSCGLVGLPALSVFILLAGPIFLQVILPHFPSCENAPVRIASRVCAGWKAPQGKLGSRRV
jgi:hypothetical protein